jgi:(2R)-3-sulfolactate dehydrogenase (NADP+)
VTRRLSLKEAADLAARACRAAGASEEAARSLALATVSADAHGKTGIGFAHLLDYLAAFREGRIDGRAEPIVSSPAPAAIHSDARGGVAQLGFDRAFDDLRRRAEAFGLALFAQSGSYTTGELGYYPRRLAEAGLVALAATSGPALMTVAGAKTPVYCTNPIAFAAPLDEGAPLVIDQASSATAFVQLRHYAERGEALPPGWAVDADGQPTTDPGEALRGALLAFGRLEARPGGTTARPAHLPAADQRSGRGDGVGSQLAGQHGLAAPPGPRRSGSEQEQDPLL